LNESKNKNESAQEIWNEIDYFFWNNCRCSTRGLVIMHGFVTLFPEVIALAIILLVMGLVAPHVLFVALRAILAEIISMTIVGSSIIAVMLVALVIVAIFTTAILMVA
jgi:hypothetical protein